MNILAAILIYVALSSRVRKALDEKGTVERVRRELSALIMELNAAADRNVSLVEDRIKSLKTALDDADRRLAVFDRELERRKSTHEVYTRLGQPAARVVRDERGRTAVEPPPEAHHGASPYALPPSPQGDAASRAAPAPVTVGAVKTEGAGRIPFVTFSQNPIVVEATLRERVLEFRKRGFTSDIIAARLGTTIAEVELVMSLEEQRALSERREAT